MFEASQDDLGVIVSKIVLKPNAIAILPFCALGMLVSAGGVAWLDVVVGLVENGFEVEVCTERVKLMTIELAFCDTTWVLKVLAACDDAAFGLVAAVMVDEDAGKV